MLIVDLHKQAQDYLRFRAEFWPDSADEPQARADFLDEVQETYGPEAAKAIAAILTKLEAR